MSRLLDEWEIDIITSSRKKRIASIGCAIIMMAYLILPLAWLIKMIFT